MTAVGRLRHLRRWVVVRRGAAGVRMDLRRAMRREVLMVRRQLRDLELEDFWLGLGRHLLDFARDRENFRRIATVNRSSRGAALLGAFGMREDGTL